VSVSVLSMASARIVSVNLGGEKPTEWGELHRTAIDKRPVASAVQAGVLGLSGDQQADKVNHGGPEQALYAYAREDLDWWSARLGRELRDGIFGENVTTAGLDVNGALIGETWRFGTIVVQVTSPRVPCVVFRSWMDEKGWIKAFRASCRPGPYLRVCQPGMIRAGDPIELLSRPHDGVTVAEVLEAYYQRDADVIRRMIATPGHSSRWDGMVEDWESAVARAS
jgi:MOSC domain-containing protein YiiM